MVPKMGGGGPNEWVLSRSVDEYHEFLFTYLVHEKKNTYRKTEKLPGPISSAMRLVGRQGCTKRWRQV